ncbi:MAG: MFS transporter [Deltaproteobacteria bacterium]|nr:MFS transporter [Deltaproteobacteria bacterium]MBW2020456.1 MFS transporter [Deltaproteobacteria bacterium]MBW2074473.1 MFS transporter [Deltaproteobacteria bacterium]
MKPSWSPSRNRAIISWCLYDWANSAFATSILAVILPLYFASLVPGEGVTVQWWWVRFTTTASALWAYGISFSLLLTALTAPILGALADFSGSKKRFLFGFTYIGVAFTLLLYFVRDGGYWLCLGLFIAANIGFAGSMPFYNAFLPEVAPEGEMDWVSGKGYALGYLGGGLLLALHVLIITYHEYFGIPDRSLGIRISLASVGIWWGVFAIPLFLWVPEVRCVRSTSDGASSLTYGFARFFRTLRHFRDYPDLLWFLLAFLVYNDGIQTVIAMAAIFGKTALGLDTQTLIGTLLMTQFVALFGALLFGRLAQRIKTKVALMLSLFLWIGIVTYAYFLRSSLEFWILGGLVGLILGGSQAISRSLYGQLIPRARSAEFFGFFTISAKFASIFGPLIFGLVTDLSENPRNAIVSLILFFVVGMIMLRRVDVERGRRQAREA